MFVDIKEQFGLTDSLIASIRKIADTSIVESSKNEKIMIDESINVEKLIDELKSKWSNVEKITPESSKKLNTFFVDMHPKVLRKIAREGIKFVSELAMKALAKHQHVVAEDLNEDTLEEGRPIYQIAREIRKDWKKPYFGAVPYLDAMESLDSIKDNYYEDSGKSVVLYFLANATTWRGDTAKKIKTELKSLMKEDLDEEQLDEISNSTLSNYINKSEKEAADYEYKSKKYWPRAVKQRGGGENSPAAKQQNISDRKLKNRTIGIMSAKIRMSEEEQLDEISNNKLKNYIIKSRNEAPKLKMNLQHAASNVVDDNNPVNANRLKRLGKKTWNREVGFHKAMNRLNSEEILDENDDRPVFHAILRRLKTTGKLNDLFKKYSFKKVMDAIEDTSDFVGDVEEIGSSDVSIWVKQTLEYLGEEKLDEISRSRLGNYIDAAGDDPRRKESVDLAINKYNRKRHRHVKEDVLDELSQRVLWNYMVKAVGDEAMSMDNATDNKKDSRNGRIWSKEAWKKLENDPKYKKRKWGIDHAGGKMDDVSKITTAREAGLSRKK